MSLADAVQEIAEQLEGDAQDRELGEEARGLAKGYARQLRTAVKANEGQDAQLGNPFAGGVPLGPHHDRVMIERAKEQMRAEKRAAEGQEAVDAAVGAGLLALVVGGSSDGDNVPIEPDMPVGAKTTLPGGVYVFGADRKFYYSEDETAKLKAQRGGKS